MSGSTIRIGSTPYSKFLPFERQIHHSCCISFSSALSWPTIPRLLPQLKNASPFPLNCRSRDSEDALSTSSAFTVLGLGPNCSADQLKAAFRAKVKEFHPDVSRNAGDSDLMIRRVIQAYEILSNLSRSEIIESECLDPFDNPECEAFDVFVNQVMCIGKGCPYSCVKTAPHAFAFSCVGTARASSQLTGEDFKVQQAVGQCPRNCIHYVTPSQRIILEEILDSIVEAPYDTSAEAELLYSLIVKAEYENNRYSKPKKEPKASTQHVDWI